MTAADAEQHSMTLSNLHEDQEFEWIPQPAFLWPLPKDGPTLMCIFGTDEDFVPKCALLGTDLDYVI